MQAKNIDRTGALLTVIALAILPLVFVLGFLVLISKLICCKIN